MDFVLATIVAVDGPSYRKPGARMLIAADGRRAGTVSGGCLEEEVARKAFWNTREGAAVEEYSTREDDGERPFGSGCGGMVRILLERDSLARPLMHALAVAYQTRLPLTIATVIEGERIGERVIGAEIAAVATQLQKEKVCVEHCPARNGLWVMGAGNDAQPLVRMASQLGWFIGVVDGRAHLATAERFPEAELVLSPKMTDFSALHFELRTKDSVVILSHSFEQDARFLAAMLKDDQHKKIAYLGVLGPRQRTRELLAEAAKLLAREPSEKLIEGWLAEIHSPMGLDLGGSDAAAIALSTLAEIENKLTASTARPLRELRR